jgi:hypothetical protein
MCYEGGTCDKIFTAKEFKFKIGSAGNGMYFSIPRSAYLINSKDLGIGSNFCILGITGLVPNNVNKFVFGSVFL